MSFYNQEQSSRGTSSTLLLSQSRIGIGSLLPLPRTSSTTSLAQAATPSSALYTTPQVQSAGNLNFGTGSLSKITQQALAASSDPASTGQASAGQTTLHGENTLAAGIGVAAAAGVLFLVAFAWVLLRQCRRLKSGSDNKGESRAELEADHQIGRLAWEKTAAASGEPVEVEGSPCTLSSIPPFRTELAGFGLSPLSPMPGRVFELP